MYPGLLLYLIELEYRRDLDSLNERLHLDNEFSFFVIFIFVLFFSHTRRSCEKQARAN